MCLFPSSHIDELLSYEIYNLSINNIFVNILQTEERLYLYSYNEDNVSVCNQNYVTTDVTFPLVIYVKFSSILFLFKSHFLRKLINTINIADFIHI